MPRRTSEIKPRKQRELRAPRLFQEEGDRLKAIRAIFTGNDWKKFADDAGLNSHVYRQNENGIYLLSIENARLLKRRYRVTLDYLYTGDDSGMPRNLIQLLADGST
jgi:hypothetical protein